MAANPSIQLGTDGNWAIKEDNLLAYKKDGTRFFNKEFDFTRGSFATFVDKDGLIKYSGVIDTELVVNGDFATDSDWIKGNGATISNGKGNIIGDGTSFTYLEQSNVFTVGKFYKVSLDAVINSGLGLKVQDGSTNENFGAITTSGTYTFYGEANNSSLVIGRRTGGTAFDSYVDNVSVKEIQLDVPRIDFTNDTKGHLLLEPQSTNLITYSEDFSQSSWIKLGAGTGSVAVVTSNYAISPEGTQNASRLQCNLNGGSTTSDQSLIYDLDATNSTKTISVYMKSNNSQNQTIYFTNTFTGDSTDEAVVTTQWQRFTFTHSTSNHTFSLGLRGGTGADDIADILIFAAQAEALSFPTSYIPTSGSTVTRNAEVCNNSGSAQDFNSSEGVLYVDTAALVSESTSKRISISDGTLTNRVSLSITDNVISGFINVNNVTQYTFYEAGQNVTNFNKIAIKYKTNDFCVFINGVKYDIDTSGSTFTANALNVIKFSNASGLSNFLYGKTRNLKVFKRAMSDGELYLLTVPQYQSYQAMATALNYTS